MRTFTDKDKRGLLIAFRVLLREMNNERLSAPTGAKLIDKALQGGVTADVLLNKFNFERAREADPETNAASYIDFLIAGEGVRRLSDEPDWHTEENGFGIVVEAAHDFYLEVSGKGGKWNLPSAFANLGRAVTNYGLNAILSSLLIEEVIANGNPDLTFFGYIAEIIKDVKTPYATLEENIRPEHGAEGPSGNEGDGSPGTDAGTQAEEDTSGGDSRPEDDPFPDMGDENEFGFQSVTETIQIDPDEVKKNTLKDILVYYTPNELLGLVKTIEGGMDLNINEILSRLAKGKFDVNAEDMATRETHKNINCDLVASFVNSALIQGQEMTEEKAAEYDILHESWDMRAATTRKLHKLLKLIYNNAKDDPDLLEAADDIEQLYSN